MKKPPINNYIDNSNNPDNIMLGTDNNIGGKKHFISRFDQDLFYENDASIVNPIFRIKHITMKTNDKEKWSMFKDDQEVYTLQSKDLTKKEIKYLHTLEGFSCLIDTFKKLNIITLKEIKKSIKDKLMEIKK